MSYQRTTRGISVSVDPRFLDERSDPSEARFLWSYTIVITNNGSETVQLLSRHWKITDGQGVLEEIKGPGVVGEQPVLKPGDSFSYTSGCPLSTPSGIMVGTYMMKAESGLRFEIDVPAFSLDSPYAQKTLN